MASVSRDVKFLTSQKTVASEKITHFFVTLHSGQLLHFANWFLQEDGSWWFDQLPQNSLSSTPSNNTFYVGKYQGWIPRWVSASSFTRRVYLPLSELCHVLWDMVYVCCYQTTNFNYVHICFLSWRAQCIVMAKGLCDCLFHSCRLSSIMTFSTCRHKMCHLFPLSFHK